MSAFARKASLLFYSFPVQLLLNHFKRHQVLLLCWMILFAMVTGNFGKYLGIPYLFLDPEYLHQVNFTSFLIMGVLTAGFTAAFHITCYINDGHRFAFIAAHSRPFRKFIINNSVLPVLFLIVYVWQITLFQLSSQFSSGSKLSWDLGGFFTGYILMTAALHIYFRFTQKDIFRYVVCRLDEKIKSTVRVTRASAMKRLDAARKKQVRVDCWLDDRLRLQEIPEDERNFYDRTILVQVFNQNHFSLVIIELLLVALILVLGIFKDYPAFQIPAAASFMILLTVFVMLAGAFSYWFGNWASSVAVLIFLLVNYLVGENHFTKPYQAFGLSYEQRTPYTVDQLRALNDTSAVRKSVETVLPALQHWRARFDAPPLMVLICSSGGGKRAALWSLSVLQTADSLTHGALMKQSVLMTGASGGLIGATYFREVKLRAIRGEDIRPYHAIHRSHIATDNLNPLIFSLLANDLFVGFTRFTYGGHSYVRDRAYTFEEQLNLDTEGILNKKVIDYRQAESAGEIPILVFSPTIVNDGRKLYISAQPMAFMNADTGLNPTYTNTKFSGIDFRSLMAAQDGDSLRLLSAMRMSATFPYITPNTTLPTDPPVQIMDAGISDNFGITDAVRFLYAFRDWVSTNTSGVIVLSIRDSPKLTPVSAKPGQSIVDALTQPIASVYNNFENFQDITNDNLLSYADTWLDVPVHRVDIQYFPTTYVPILQNMDSIRQHNARASLSWRLTAREKQGVVETVEAGRNRQALQTLVQLLKQ